MASKDTDSRMQKTKTDTFIQDYLSDVWGDMLASNKELINENIPQETVIHDSSSTLLIENTENIKKQFSLIPTIKLFNCSEDQVIRTQTESTIILLTNLYFLRRPLSPKVRQFIINLSEQVIDDYHASYWLQGSILKEVHREV